MSSALLIPGRRAECGEQRVAHVHHQPEGVESGEDEVESGQHDEAVDAESHQHRHHVPAQLLERRLRVIHRNDATGQDRRDADRGEPAVKHDVLSDNLEAVMIMVRQSAFTC